MFSKQGWDGWADTYDYNVPFTSKATIIIDNYTFERILNFLPSHFTGKSYNSDAW